MLVFRSIALLLSTSLTSVTAYQESLDHGSLWEQLDHCPSCADWFTKLFNFKDETENKLEKDAVDSAKENPENKLEIDAVDSWTTEDYKVERRQYKQNGQCIEEINISWNGNQKPLQFKPKCLDSGSFRTTNHENDKVLLIGGPAEDFLVFGMKKGQFVYKENSNWKKASLESGKVKEAPVTSINDIDKIKESYEKYLQECETHKSKMKMFMKEKMVEGKRHSDELDRIKKLKEEENEHYQGEQASPDNQKIDMELTSENDYHKTEDDRLIEDMNKEKLNFEKKFNDLAKNV